MLGWVIGTEASGNNNSIQDIPVLLIKATKTLLTNLGLELSDTLTLNIYDTQSSPLFYFCWTR